MSQAIFGPAKLYPEEAVVTNGLNLFVFTWARLTLFLSCPLGDVV